MLWQWEFIFMEIIDCTNLSLQYLCLKLVLLSIIAGVLNS